MDNMSALAFGVLAAAKSRKYGMRCVDVTSEHFSSRDERAVGAAILNIGAACLLTTLARFENTCRFESKCFVPRSESLNETCMSHFNPILYMCEAAILTTTDL